MGNNPTLKKGDFSLERATRHEVQLEAWAKGCFEADVV